MFLNSKGFMFLNSKGFMFLNSKGFMFHQHQRFYVPTAEGRQFINGNSHHPQTTFKSILFGATITLRRLNQRKDDYLSSLNRLKEKAIHSKFPLNMTNDMIALAFNWEDRLRPQNGTRKKTHRFGLHLFPICLL